ncbi:MAG TPA: SDR family oxidoreductase [Kribbella sp.]|nr:SDR family oxidoreductase [Kribbella sp.]
MNGISNKVAVVIGGSRGIGRAMSTRLAREGAAVLVCYAHDPGPADQTVAEISKNGGHAAAQQCDLADLQQIAATFDRAETDLGTVDILMVNGAAAVIGPVTEVTPTEYDQVFAVNSRGVFFAMQQAAQRLNDGGRIIVTSTGGTKMLFPGNSVYLGSKGAAEQFVRTFAQELAHRSITVNAILPGFTDTDLLPDRDRAVAAQASPFGRIGRPEEVADAAVLLASDDARWITGQALGAAGGVF